MTYTRRNLDFFTVFLHKQTMSWFFLEICEENLFWKNKFSCVFVVSQLLSQQKKKVLKV